MAQERYTRSGGILAVRANEHVGPLPAEVPDQRGRVDTVGRTVYFAERETTAFAEVLQEFRAARIALQADANAIGVDVEEYLALVRADAEVNARERPWAVNVNWQMSRSLHRVTMPATALSGTTSEDRAVTTILAEHIRSQTLFDGSRPLGIEFSSKTGYGTCWAWWDRRSDDGLTPGQNDPKTIEDYNVDGTAFRTVTTDWELEVLPGQSHS